MGQAKRAMEDAEELLFWATDDVVCISHVSDPFLRAHLPPRDKGEVCVICGADDESVVDLDALLDLVVSVIRTYWGRAVDDLYHDSESESGYAFATVLSTDDVVSDVLAGAVDDDLLMAVGEQLNPEEWYDPATIWLLGKELLSYSWRQFTQWMRDSDHPVLDEVPEEDEDSYLGEHADGVPPSGMLARLVSVITEVGPVAPSPVEVPWFRARHLGENASATAASLGTAPSTLATRANRMSPAGVPMFYGALDEDTALAEIGNSPPGQRSLIGRWVPTRSLKVLDLTHLPDLPSFFDIEHARDRQALQFMEEFARDVSQPLTRGIEAERGYRPTQALTGYLRAHVPELEGIIYPSSLTGAPCCVLFVDDKNCVDAGQAAAGREGTQLVLSGTTEVGQ
jgi:hypothetical protein